MIEICLSNGMYYVVKYNLRAMAMIMQDNFYKDDDFIEFTDAKDGTSIYVRKRDVVSFCLTNDETGV